MDLREALDAAQAELEALGLEPGGMIDFEGAGDCCDVWVEVFNKEYNHWLDIWHVPLKRDQTTGELTLSGTPYKSVL
jgi:hypothetical protein